jgi:hypothetical protein
LRLARPADGGEREGGFWICLSSRASGFGMDFSGFQMKAMMFGFA